MNNPLYSASDSDVSEKSENTYCIFLHIVEGIGLNLRDGLGDYSDRHIDKIILNASLNGVKFEVEGHSTETAIIFNSNCIWECELGDMKRLKTDNRPVKIECFVKSTCSQNSPRRLIGSLLLPIRGVQAISTLKDAHFKLHWHKLGALDAKWRQARPEIYLLLIIVKKQLIESGQLEALLSNKKCPTSNMSMPYVSETALMLQSQSNVYVQLLEQLGVIQVGNNPDIDCDIFHVTVTFMQLRNVEKLLEQERGHNQRASTLAFHFDFLGSVSQLEIIVNGSECYNVNEKISLSFKSSLKSLRLYFQRIFYIPINLFYNGIAIANYNFDVGKLLPDDFYFDMHKLYAKNGSFYFDRLHKILSPRAAKPSVDFIFSIQLNSYSKCSNMEMNQPNETHLPYKVDEKAAGDISDCYRNLGSPDMMQFHKRLGYENYLSDRNYQPMTNAYEKHDDKSNTEALLIQDGHTLQEKVDLYLKSAEEYVNDHIAERKKFEDSSIVQENMRKETTDQCVGTNDILDPEGNTLVMYQHKNVGTDNKENNANLLNSTSTAMNTELTMQDGCALVTTTDPTVLDSNAVDNVEGQVMNVAENVSQQLDAQTNELLVPQPVAEEQPSVEVATKQPSPLVCNADEVTFRVVQELEEWKSQQMEHFLCELERKEKAYLLHLDNQWEQQRVVLQARLDAKIAQCEELNAKLEKAHADARAQAANTSQNVNIVNAVKREIEGNYSQKFNLLESEMQRLKVEMQQRGTVFEIKNKEVKIENTKLEREKADLNERLEYLEQELVRLRKTHMPTEHLKKLLIDARLQKERVHDLERSKNYYKDEWTKTTHEVHKLKLTLLQQQQKCLNANNSKDIDICIEEILNDEQNALNSDRSELKSIKDMLFISSDTSTCEFEAD